MMMCPTSKTIQESLLMKAPLHLRKICFCKANTRGHRSECTESSTRVKRLKAKVQCCSVLLQEQNVWLPVAQTM